jgi:hypothetical protein
LILVLLFSLHFYAAFFGGSMALLHKSGEGFIL